MADYPNVLQSPKSTWTPINQQVNVIGPNDKPYVADDGRNYDVLHYDVVLIHDLIGDAEKNLVEDHYYDNRRLRFLFQQDPDWITYNCMYKSPTEIIKGEHNHWIIKSFFVASTTNLT